MHPLIKLLRFRGIRMDVLRAIGNLIDLKEQERKRTYSNHDYKIYKLEAEIASLRTAYKLIHSIEDDTEA